jgi:hypothetical protein
MLKSLMIATALMAGLFNVAAASAEEDGNAACGTAAKTSWMSVDDFKAKKTAEGYKVRSVKVEGNCYELYAMDKDGKKVEGLVNPATGELVGGEAD